MRVLVTGGLGFIGTQLSKRLLEKGHQVTVVDQVPQPRSGPPDGLRYIFADTTQKGTWQDEIAGQAVVINLAGASIFRRWTKGAKKSIYDSRVLTTRHVAEAMPKENKAILCSTSAVGYYGFQGDEACTEEGAPGDDFLARVCVDWENEALRAAEKGCRVVILRFGVVLGKTGGALAQMIPPFKRFVGGPLGKGNQWFSWIHMADLLKALLFVLEAPTICGPVNCCAPQPVRNKDLAKTLGKVLSRPSFFRTPAFMLRLVLGEFSALLLEGQRVMPDKLLKHHFSFRYPQIMDALKEVMGKEDP